MGGGGDLEGVGGCTGGRGRMVKGEAKGGRGGLIALGGLGERGSCLVVTLGFYQWWVALGLLVFAKGARLPD